MKYGPAKEAEIFKKLIEKSTLVIGLEYGFDKVYTSNANIRNAITSIKTRVKNHPENYTQYGITDAIIEAVNDAALSRSVSRGITKAKNPGLISTIDSGDLKGLITSVRNKAFTLLGRKLDYAAKNRKELDKISVADLNKMAGTAFDKAQILSGQATENIAIMAKIDSNMSPEDALKAVATIRENNAIKNDIRNR